MISVVVGGLGGVKGMDCVINEVNGKCVRDSEGNLTITVQEKIQDGNVTIEIKDEHNSTYKGSLVSGVFNPTAAPIPSMESVAPTDAVAPRRTSVPISESIEFEENNDVDVEET